MRHLILYHLDTGILITPRFRSRKLSSKEEQDPKFYLWYCTVL